MLRYMACRVSRRLQLSSGTTASNSLRTLCTSKGTDEVSKIILSDEELPMGTESRVGGFARAFEKYTNIKDEEPQENHTFATMLRNSKLMDLGDPEGKIVIGKIFHTVADDLYIDFGWKFHCVCPRPPRNAEEYVRGARVRLEVRDLELSSRFLGSEVDLTLLEADCRLLGIVSSPVRRTADGSK